MWLALLAVFVTSVSLSAKASPKDALPWIDCKTPQGEEEQILCGHKSLKEKYDTLVRQFQTQFNRAPEVLRPAMAHNFSAWNKYLKALCAERGAPNDKTDYAEECLNSTISDKRSDLNKEFQCTKYIGCYLHVNNFEVSYRQDRGGGYRSRPPKCFFLPNNENNF